MEKGTAGFTLLLVEDDDGQADLIERNLARAGLKVPIVRARDGREAVSYFDSPNSGDGPVVLILDIRMPRMDGVDVLQHLKSNKETAQVPIYVFSTTDDRREIDRCFQLGCNAYITKPVAYDAFTEVVRQLAGFLKVAAVPGRTREARV